MTVTFQLSALKRRTRVALVSTQQTGRFETTCYHSCIAVIGRQGWLIVSVLVLTLGASSLSGTIAVLLQRRITVT